MNDASDGARWNDGILVYARRRSQGAAAGALAVATLVAGLRWGAMVAGGSDSYGYLSQAGLWLRGLPTVRQDIARTSPWPDAAETWAPLGYRPSPRQRGIIVPIYAPGLPLLMALFQAIGGYCAGFLVVPLCGASTVWLTFLLARRVFQSGVVAVTGAMLVATSPTFLYQLMNAMSDVPVTAFATLALVLAVARRPAASGLAMSVAIAIRPNLAPLALPIAAWLLMVDRWALVWFALGVGPAVAGIAWLNATLYESPLVSGYGTTGDLYALGFFTANARQFARSIARHEFALLAAAVLYLVVLGLSRQRIGLMRRRLSTESFAHARLLLGGWIVVVLSSYLFYQPFDAWWYLRFLLPMWPVVMSMAAAVFVGTARRGGLAIVGVAATVLLAIAGVVHARAVGTFDLARSERRYVDVGRFVASHTEPDAVVLSVQHSGSLRLYADRLTLRFTVLGPAWLDRAVDYLQSSGRHPYFVLDGAEVDAFKQRFGEANRMGRLDWQPLATLGQAVAIYDPIARSDSPPLAIAQTRGSRRWWNCEAPQSWPPVRRMK